jgi:hypothetical protein
MIRRILKALFVVVGLYLLLVLLLTLGKIGGPTP